MRVDASTDGKLDAAAEAVERSRCRTLRSPRPDGRSSGTASPFALLRERGVREIVECTPHTLRRTYILSALKVESRAPTWCSVPLGERIPADRSQTASSPLPGGDGAIAAGFGPGSPPWGPGVNGCRRLTPQVLKTT
jgi:hypothetical protein